MNIGGERRGPWLPGHGSCSPSASQQRGKAGERRSVCAPAQLLAHCSFTAPQVFSSSPTAMCGFSIPVKGECSRPRQSRASQSGITVPRSKAMTVRRQKSISTCISMVTAAFAFALVCLRIQPVPRLRTPDTNEATLVGVCSCSTAEAEHAVRSRGRTYERRETTRECPQPSPGMLSRWTAGLALSPGWLSQRG